MIVTISGNQNGRLIVKFPYERTLVDAVKAIPGRSWNPEKKVWTLPDTQEHVDRLLDSLWASGLFTVHDDALDPDLSMVALMDRLGQALRARHYSPRTEQAYCHWTERFIYYSGNRRPEDMAEPEINAFLTHLAAKEKVSASTQTQALSALLFLYRNVFGREVGELGEIIRARRSKRLPVVMTRDEVREVIEHLRGDKRLMAGLLYGAGLRLIECLQLRVQDIDFSQNEILVRDGKGAKDRVTMLPESLKAPLQEHLRKVKLIHDRDVAAGWGRVQLPDALDRKYSSAATDWRWQWVFPQETRWKNSSSQFDSGGACSRLGGSSAPLHTCLVLDIRLRLVHDPVGGSCGEGRFFAHCYRFSAPPSMASPMAVAERTGSIRCKTLHGRPSPFSLSRARPFSLINSSCSKPGG